MADTTTTPDVTTTIDQTFFLTPLGGPQHPQTYLDRFPDTVYNKALDTHLVRFMYALLGPAGVGWLRKNYLQARLLLEDHGVESFDLDRFYGDPIRFGRILEEVYDEDPRALLSREDWEKIRTKDAAYRNRALDYIAGVRAGNTPLGMHLVARSGLGHECEIIENYRYIYDQYTDDPLELEKFGVTNSTEEMIVLPRRELPQGEIQVIHIDNTPTSGTFKLFFPMGNEAANTTAPLAYNATNNAIQLALEALPTIGVGNVRVTGGPLPGTDVQIFFTGDLAIRDLPEMQPINALNGPVTPILFINTQQNGHDQTDEVVAIPARDQRYLRDALEFIKPVTTIVTYGRSPGLRKAAAWNAATTDSVYHEVVRFVTGQSGVLWPATDNNHWIEGSVEHQAQRANELNHHYRGYHNIADVFAYTESALGDPDYLTDNWTSIRDNHRNEHLGQFSNYQKLLYAPLASSTPDNFVYSSDQSLADYAEPLTVTATTDDIQLINGIYPIDYSTLPGVPEIKYKTEQFWASKEREDGDDYIEVDLGRVQAVNYIYFEATQKPYDIEVHYDLLDSAPSRVWQPVNLQPDLSSTGSLGYDVGSRNPWEICEIWPETPQGTPIFTRFIRLKFARRNDSNSPFINSDGTSIPYSIEIRNLRVARNVS